MQVQYVVGLCCLRRNPEAVDVIVGDLVRDTAAGKERDVDVTVTLREADGSIRAFKGYEVKREGEPLDVVAIEQLCAKLNDMPAITTRAVISTSGYTSASVRKAAAHNVELYELKPWTRPLAEQFPHLSGLGKPEEFLKEFTTNLLHWTEYSLWLTVAPPDTPDFSWTGTTPVFGPRAHRHETFTSMADVQDAFLMRSTGALWDSEPAKSIAANSQWEPVAGTDYEAPPTWPHTHTLDTRDCGVYLKVNDELVQVQSVTITGRLQWRRRAIKPEFHILEGVPSGEVFAAAAIADYQTDDGRMFALIFPPDSRTLQFHQFQLAKKHRNAIRKLKIPMVKA